MEYRELGSTGMKLSILGYGASSLGGVFHEFNEKEGIRSVYSAIDYGINFIDVSPYYGFTRAEEVLGKALRGINRDTYYLSTKVGRYGANGIKEWDYSGARAAKSVEDSLFRLNISFIDLINVHDIEFSDLNIVVNETIPALLKLKQQGKVGHIGITGLPLDKLLWVTENVSEGTVESVLSFCHYCLIDDSLLDFVPFFKTKGAGIINASPLSMGLLTARGAPSWHPASGNIIKHCSLAAELCKTKNYPIEQLAIKYSVSNPDITTTLVSTTSPDNIKQNIKWAEAGQNEELLAKVSELLKPVHRETWNNS
jgi:aryl-alcohol dehydrogenase-like predicted oxidoreductase